MVQLSLVNRRRFLLLFSYRFLRKKSTPKGVMVIRSWRPFEYYLDSIFQICIFLFTSVFLARRWWGCCFTWIPSACEVIFVDTFARSWRWCWILFVPPVGTLGRRLYSINSYVCRKIYFLKSIDNYFLIISLWLGSIITPNNLTLGFGVQCYSYVQRIKSGRALGAAVFAGRATFSGRGRAMRANYAEFTITLMLAFFPG